MSFHHECGHFLYEKKMISFHFVNLYANFICLYLTSSTFIPVTQGIVRKKVCKKEKYTLGNGRNQQLALKSANLNYTTA